MCTPFSLQSLRIQNEDDSNVYDPDRPQPLQCCPCSQPRRSIWFWPRKRFQPLTELLWGQLPAKQPESELKSRIPRQYIQQLIGTFYVIGNIFDRYFGKGCHDKKWDGLVSLFVLSKI